MSELKFPSQAVPLTTVPLDTPLMTSKGAVLGSVTVEQVADKAAEKVQVDGGAIPAIKGGATAATATVLPNIGAGTNKFFDASSGFWKYNNIVLLNPNGVEGIPDGSDGVVFFDGATEVWSISKVQELPTAQGEDTFNPAGTNVANERATARYIDKLIPLNSFNLPKPTNIPSGFSIMQQGVFTQNGGMDIDVPNGNIGIGKYSYNDAEYISKYNGSFSVGALRIVGTVDGTATTYKRLGITSSSSMIATSESESLYYTGKINNANYAGVLCYDASLSLLGAVFSGIGEWDRSLVLKPTGTAYVSMCSDVTPPVIESLQSTSVWGLEQLIPIPTDPNAAKYNDFEISPASDNVFNKLTDVKEGYSLSSGGITLENATSSMSQRKTLPIGVTHLGIWGRVRKPFVFYNASGGRIGSSFENILNGVFEKPSNAVTYDFAINYQGNGAGTENEIMVVYGYGEAPEEPTEYIPYKNAAVTAITIGGVKYPFQVEGGLNPDPSSVKMRVKYTITDEVIIISNFDEGQFLKTVFCFTGNNMTFLPNSSGTITAASFTEDLFDSVIESNLLQWNVSDGIGPYRLVNEVINTNDFVGGNHGAPEPAASTPPYYQYETSKTISHEVWADGNKLSIGDRVDVEKINVRVVNEVYNVDGFYINPVVSVVDFNEIQESEFSNNQLSLKVRLSPVRSGVQFKTVYGLQMQLGLALQRIFAPKTLYTAIENRNVNPNTPEGRSYGDKDNFNDFDRFYVMDTSYQKVATVWLDIDAGLGTRDKLLGTSPILRFKTLKGYDNLLDIPTSVAMGEELFYQGGVNLFSNKYSLEQAFVYQQEIKGHYEWEKKKVLVIDFANSINPRTIKVDVPKGKKLELLESYGDVDVPVLVTADFFSATCNTGSGGVKYLIR